MNITEYTVEQLVDPTGFIVGERYEFRLYAKLDEDDDLYAEDGIGIRTILAIGDGEDRLVVAHFFNRATEEVHDVALEEDELKTLLQFCQKNYQDESIS